MDERKHLVFAEVEKLMEVTKGSRNAARDKCLVLLMFRHGLRVSEARDLLTMRIFQDDRVGDGKPKVRHCGDAAIGVRAQLFQCGSARGKG